MGHTTIHHGVRRQFDLTLNEYAICDSIYYLSRSYPCTASKEYLGDFIGVSRQSVQKILNKLIGKKLLSKTKKCLITTELWNNAILKTKIPIPECQESLQKSVHKSVNFLDTTVNFLDTTVKKVYTDCKESLHNNNIDSYSNNNINKDICEKPKNPKKPKYFNLCFISPPVIYY